MIKNSLFSLAFASIFIFSLNAAETNPRLQNLPVGSDLIFSFDYQKMKPLIELDQLGCSPDKKVIIELLLTQVNNAGLSKITAGIDFDSKEADGQTPLIRFNIAAADSAALFRITSNSIKAKSTNKFTIKESIINGHPALIITKKNHEVQLIQSKGMLSIGTPKALETSDEPPKLLANKEWQNKRRQAKSSEMFWAFCDLSSIVKLPELQNAPDDKKLLLQALQNFNFSLQASKSLIAQSSISFSNKAQQQQAFTQLKQLRDLLLIVNQAGIKAAHIKISSIANEITIDINIPEALLKKTKAQHLHRKKKK